MQFAELQTLLTAAHTLLCLSLLSLPPKVRDLILGKEEGKKDFVSEELLLTGFPRNWPAPFKESAELKRLLKTNLRATRVRAIEPNAEATAAAKRAGTPLLTLHSFGNATRLHEALGWKIVQGFVVYEMLDKPLAEQFVAVRHW